MNNNNDETIVANLLKDFKGTFEELNNTMVQIQTSMSKKDKDGDRANTTFKWLIAAMAIIFIIIGAPMFLWFYSMVDDMRLMSKSMVVMTDNVTEMSKNLNKMSNDMHNMLDKINSMSIEIKTMSGNMGNMSHDIHSMSTNVNNMTIDMNQISSDMRNMRYATVSIQNGLNNMTQDIGVMTKDVNQMSNTVSPTIDGVRQLMLLLPFSSLNQPTNK